MIEADLLLRNIRELLTAEGPAPLSGTRQRQIRAIHDAAIASRAGRIVFVGTTREADAAVTVTGSIHDLRGRSVVPGFVDPHTHAAFAGDRRDELRRRL